MKLLDLNIEKIRVNGGGAKSPLWIQIIADVLNVTVEKINTNEGPALGAAILAAVGCHAYPDVLSACEAIIKVTETIQPIHENVRLYDKKYSKFKQIYPALKQVFKALN